MLLEEILSELISKDLENIDTKYKLGAPDIQKIIEYLIKFLDYIHFTFDEFWDLFQGKFIKKYYLV